MWGRLGGVRFAALALAITALLLAGCGDDDEEATETGSEESATLEIDGEPANDEGTEAVTADPIELEEDDYYFEPTVLTGDPGQKVTLEITNEGDEEHNITIDDQGIDEDTEPGESTTVRAEIPDSGLVPFYCSYHEAQNMRGALAVTGSEPTASTESETTPSAGGGY
jgi:plastocyanin